MKIRKVLSVLLGLISLFLFGNGSLVALSNHAAKLRPDGLPLDPASAIYLPLFFSVVLTIIALAIYPFSPRKNRYIKNYKSKLSDPLDRVL